MSNNTISSVVSFEHSTRSYNASQYRTRVVGTSDMNAFIPFYSLFAHTLYYFEDDQIRVMEYSLPITGDIYSSQRTYSQMFQVLKRTSSPRRYNFSISGTNKHVNLHRGLIYRDNTIYMALAVDSQYIMGLSSLQEMVDNPDYSKFILIVDNSFESNEEFKNIYKKINNAYIQVLKNNNIDILYTNNVANILYKNNSVKPDFKSMKDMQEHLKSVPNALLIE